MQISWVTLKCYNTYIKINFFIIYKKLKIILRKNDYDDNL